MIQPFPGHGRKRKDSPLLLGRGRERGKMDEFSIYRAWCPQAL